MNYRVTRTGIWTMTETVAYASSHGYQLNTSPWTQDIEDRFIWAVDDYRAVPGLNGRPNFTIPINMAAGIADTLAEAMFEAERVADYLQLSTGCGSGLIDDEDVA